MPRPQTTPNFDHSFAWLSSAATRERRVMALHGLGEEGFDLTVLIRSLEEIELLKLKYENLVIVCEQLLKPWYGILINFIQYLSTF